MLLNHPSYSLPCFRCPAATLNRKLCGLPRQAILGGVRFECTLVEEYTQSCRHSLFSSASQDYEVRDYVLRLPNETGGF